MRKGFEFMKAFEDKIKDREVIYIEDFVLVKSNQDKTFNDKEDRNAKKKEKGAYVGVDITKESIMVYSIYNMQGEKIGIADYNTGKILKWKSSYKINKKTNIKEMLENQLNKDKERNLKSVSGLKKEEKKNNNKEQPEEKKKNPLSKDKEIINKKQKEESQEEKVISQKQLSQINNVKIKDYEFVADLINPNQYNIYDTYFINNKGKFEMVSYDFNLGGYKKIDEYMYKETKIGEMDTIEKNRKETEIGNGCEVTFIARNGKRQTIDAKQGATGEIELRKKGDIDKDKTTEGIKISTDRDNQNEKVEKISKIEDDKDVNKSKEEKGIQSDEINVGPLTDEQMKQQIKEAHLSEDQEILVINKIKEITSDYKKPNPTEEALNEIIEGVKENNLENDREDSDDELHTKEPGITYSKGIKMFRGKPAE